VNTAGYVLNRLLLASRGYRLNSKKKPSIDKQLSIAAKQRVEEIFFSFQAYFF
jgi:hypothetical protein